MKWAGIENTKQLTINGYNAYAKRMYTLRSDIN